MDVDYLLEKGKLIKINSKYGLLLRSQKEITYNYKTYIVYRIVALKDFGDVEKGELGGYIDKASSIDEKGDCWLYPTCYCLHYSFLSGNTKVKKILLYFLFFVV